MPEGSRTKNSVSFGHLQNNTKSQWWRDPCLRVNVFHCTGLYFTIFYLGYDGALLNGLQELPPWNEYFGSPTGSYLGLIAACLFLPAIITPFFGEIINARWGRKPCMAVSCSLLIIGAFINAFAKSAGMFMGGRVFIGAAGAMGKITAAALLQEIAHPRLRPIITTSFYCNYYFGAVAAAWFCYGTLHWGDTEWAWRAPCLFQIVAPLVILAYLTIIPESPRWLVHHGYKAKALSILARYHANGDVDDELVRYEFNEICIAIENEQVSNSKTHYADFFKTPGNRRRFLVTVVMATGGNWVGNGVISYYLTPILKLVGITENEQIAAINGGLATWNLIIAWIGSTNAERLGRRKLWLISTAGMLLSISVITGLSGSFAQHENSAVGLAVVPWLFIFYGFYDFGWTPLPYSYGAEIMPYHMRVKGVGLQLSIQSLAQAFNQWVNPVALSSIGWKYYIVYIIMDAMYLVLIILYFPETRGLTVEEVSVLFDTGRLGSAAAAAADFEQQDGSLSINKQVDASEERREVVA